MAPAPVHYGWLVSPYSAKTRSYLKHRGLDVRDVEPSVFQMMGTIQRSVGRVIMPTVHLADGTWLQDSSVIIDHFEAAAPEPTILPPGPTQRLAASLLEVFADEWLPMAALYYRWSIPENVAFAKTDFARSGLPWVPRFIGRRFIAPFADKMKSYLEVLGIDEMTSPGVVETAGLVLRTLEEHLAESPYLFGGRPSLGDFSLFGPLWAHLYRDPGSRFLFDETPHVRRWFDDLLAGAPPRGDFMANDQVASALEPLFACVLTEQWPWIQTLVAAIDDYCAQHPSALRVPRALGEAEFEVQGRVGRRKLITFVQWKAQRARDAYVAAAGSADPWLRRVLGTSADADVSARITPMDNRLILREFKPVLEARQGR
jgi:glutathione S-transferase